MVSDRRTPRAASIPSQLQHVVAASFSTSRLTWDLQSLSKPVSNPVAPAKKGQAKDEDETRHAVVSTFDLFSIGISPSSRYYIICACSQD